MSSSSIITSLGVFSPVALIISKVWRGRKRSRSAVVRAAARFEVRMSSRLDGRCHRISNAAASAGNVAGDGAFEALCGHRVRPTAMVSPDGPDCPACDTHSTPAHRPSRA